MKLKLTAACFSLLLASMAVGAAQLSSRVIEASDALIEIPLAQSKQTITVLAGTVDMLYADEPSKKDAPALLSIKNAEIIFDRTSLSSPWILLDPNAGEIQALSLNIEFGQHMAKSGGTVSLRCSGGQLIKNGQGTGTYPTRNLPNTSIMPGASVYCTGTGGNMIGVTFPPRTIEP